MSVFQSTITVPSNGSSVTVFTNQASNANQLSIRNTGTVNVLLGPSGSTPAFPLNIGEYLGLSVGPDDTLVAAVQTTGTAGQIVILGMG